MTSSITSRISSSGSKNILAHLVHRGDDHSRTSSMENSSENIDPSSFKSHTEDSPLSLKKANDTDSSASNGNKSNTFTTLPKYTKSLTSSIVSPSSPSEIRVKVNIESNGNGSNIVYKKMSINDKYRTKDVKRLILEKFFLSPDISDKYQLVQILDPQNYTSSFTSDELFEPSHEPTKELVINDNCNVFYAAKNMPDMLFVLRKKDGEMVTSGYSNNSSSSLGHPNNSGGGSPVIGLRNMNRVNSTYASSGGSNYKRTNNPAKNIYDQLPPQAPGKAKSGSLSAASGSNNGSGSGESGSNSKNWKFFKKILS
jgi:hypothetical protein